MRWVARFWAAILEGLWGAISPRPLEKWRCVRRVLLGLGRFMNSAFRDHFHSGLPQFEIHELNGEAEAAHESCSPTLQHVQNPIVKRSS